MNKWFVLVLEFNYSDLKELCAFRFHVKFGEIKIWEFKGFMIPVLC